MKKYCASTLVLNQRKHYLKKFLIKVPGDIFVVVVWVWATGGGGGGCTGSGFFSIGGGGGGGACCGGFFWIFCISVTFKFVMLEALRDGIIREFASFVELKFNSLPPKCANLLLFDGVGVLLSFADANVKLVVLP